jgi:hypothetical protein
VRTSAVTMGAIGRGAMRAAFGLLLAAAFSAVGPLRAEEVKSGPQIGTIKTDTKSCEVPAYLLATESVLGKVADKIKADRTVDVLVIGSGSSTLSGPDGASVAYPARLQSYLSDALSGVAVHVTTDIHFKQTADEVAETFDKIVKERKPNLVIWQTGTVDAMRSVDVDDFRNAIKDGVAALKGMGVGVILVNQQYNPRMETMVSVAPYLDILRVVAQESDVPLLDRFAIMRHWNETGEFDLSITTHSLTLAKSVHDCLGRALANLVVEASRVNPAELRIKK